jgi:hypothetical protein
VIDSLVAALRSAGVDLDWRDLADVLWLAAIDRTRSPTPTPASATPAEIDTAAGTLSRDVINTRPAKSDGRDEVDASFTLDVTFDDAGDSRPESAFDDATIDRFGLEAVAPRRYALPGALQIGRSLRPLKLRRVSPDMLELDTEATVAHYCDTRVLVPILRATKGRWFNVAIVADTGPSMSIWDETIEVFSRMLERHGAFRDVQTWRFDNTTDEVRVVSAAAHVRLPRELIDRSGRRLIVVVTDGVHERWCLDPVWATLTEWGTTSHTALAHLLPPHMWSHTQMPAPEVILSTSAAAMTSSALHIDEPWWWEDPQPPHGAIPLIRLHEDPLGTWARMVRGDPRASLPGILTTRPAWLDDGPAQRLGQGAEPTADSLRTTLSVDAIRLATYLSAVPVTLPIARAVLQHLLPKARLEQLAELVAAGVMTPTSASASDPRLATGELLMPETTRTVLERSLTTTMTFDVVESSPTISNRPATTSPS